MPQSLLFPLEQVKPSEILSQYSEWIYFTLVLVFFISISGITLRKHFDKPYVKPLIISVGLMLTVGVFMYKERLTAVFEGWGILGTVVLVTMAATIPYGLCRGFGVSANRAFFLSYILIYILSWVKFPDFYSGLADRNLGLINLGLLILFIIAVIKVVKFGRFHSFGSKDLAKNAPFEPEIQSEIESEDEEKRVIAGRAEKMTKLEIRSVEDIARALDEIQRTLETHRNNLPGEERKRIAHSLHQISRDEDIFKRNVRNLQKLFQRIGTVDAKRFREMKDRLEKATGKEKRLLKAEIAGEEEKIQMERAVFELERKLGQALNSFNQFVKAAIGRIRKSPYPYDAVQPLVEAKKVLDAILQMIREIKELEKKLVVLIKTEKRLLKKEEQEV
jgi:uncharacterized protein (DUF2267 family)